jgi:hypothetical protein
MSEPLNDVRTKVDSITFAFIRAEARARGVEPAVVMRDILHVWGAEKHRSFKCAHNLLRAEGQLETE